jgi:GrpB-like predicted nucleotidyltransferase (UPF0157 family)
MFPFDPSWSAIYERERWRLVSVLEPWLVEPLEHIGSTSIPGLVAKPIIDIVAVVDDIDRGNEIVSPLDAIGWVAAPEPGDVVWREMSFCTPSVERRTHHLHVVERSSSSWRGWVAFRDYLRVHPEIAAEYSELKCRLADEYGADPNERDAYRAGKASWISTITALALEGRT